MNGSAIERMLAHARRDSLWPIKLTCPACDREEYVQVDATDPRGTVAMVYPCPDCRRDGYSDNPIYLDANGKKIDAEG